MPQVSSRRFVEPRLRGPQRWRTVLHNARIGDFFVVSWVASVGLFFWVLVDITKRTDTEWPSSGWSRTAWLFAVLVFGFFARLSTSRKVHRPDLGPGAVG